MLLAVSKLFLTPIRQWIWLILLTLCVYMDGKVSVVFNRNCFYRAMLSICRISHGPVSVSLSVTSRCSIETAERIELIFGTWAFFHLSYSVLKGNSVISKNKGTFLWNFVLNSGLGKFRHGISIVEMCYQLSFRKVDAQSVINWAVVSQLIPPSPDARPL